MELFERQWQTYRSIIDHDWMEHADLTATCRDALRSWMAAHPEAQGRARLLDLGCGDLALMGPVFRELPLGGYIGVDLTEQVLPMARSALGTVGYPAEFRQTDVRSFVEADGEPFDLVHASLVLHHLPDDEKPDFLTALVRRIRPDGLLLWADVFREPGESVAAYADRYATRIRNGWSAIESEAREAIVTHMSTYDFPADRDAIVGVARRCGWNWRWLWHGAHRAEAVAALTPAAP